MYQNYYYQQNRNDYIPQYSLKGRPVSSMEEARAAQVDFDGSLFLFPDMANQKIYTKQIGMDGTASMKMYCLAPIEEIKEKEYVTKEEFDSAVEQLKALMEVKPKEQTTLNF